jgi:hypothetical protein
VQRVQPDDVIPFTILLAGVFTAGVAHASLPDVMHSAGAMLTLPTLSYHFVE